MEEIDALIVQLRTCPEGDRAPIIAQLTEHASGARGDVVREHLSRAARSEVLEIQWELEDIVEATSPAPPTPRPVTYTAEHTAGSFSFARFTLNDGCTLNIMLYAR